MDIRQTVRTLLINVIVIFALLFLIEGMVSYVTIGSAFFNQKIAERQHTEYDEELGWINLPDVFIEDMYSREDPLTTNSQRYRNKGDFSVEVPPGKVRIVCSGDSFTLGFGVDDDHTWCQQLTTLDERLETVNMGQGGYGVDQAYLWYRRDQAKLVHDVLLFAFISDDFSRMESDTFMGYGKPYLSVHDGELIQDNFPVPRRAYDASWLTVNLPMWQELDTVKFLNEKLGKYLPQAETAFVARDHAHTDEVVAKIYASLQVLSVANDRLAVLVYLPTRGDYNEAHTNRWRRLVQDLASQHDYLFIDVAEEMLKLSPDEFETMFRKGGHYTDEGNRYVAEIILARLSELPEFPAILPIAN
jgi:hypothetical protein